MLVRRRITIVLGTPASGEASAHCFGGKFDLLAQMSAVCEQRTYRGAGVPIVPGKRFINRVRGVISSFERAQVVILLCRATAGIKSPDCQIGVRIARSFLLCSATERSQPGFYVELHGETIRTFSPTYCLAGSSNWGPSHYLPLPPLDSPLKYLERIARVVQVLADKNRSMG